MKSSSLSKRLAKLESAIVRIDRDNPTQNLTGWPSDKISEAVDAAIDPAHEDLVEKIIGHVNELAAIPWQNQTTKEKYLTDDGKEQPTPHYFLYWLWGLGSARGTCPNASLVTFWKDSIVCMEPFCFAARIA